MDSRLIYTPFNANEPIHTYPGPSIRLIVASSMQCDDKEITIRVLNGESVEWGGYIWSLHRDRMYYRLNRVKTSNSALIPVTYTTVWDDGIEVATKALYNKDTQQVKTEAVDAPGLEICKDEYITMPDGARIQRYEKDGKENFHL